MSTTLGDFSIFLQSSLSNTGVPSYLGAAKQGATYPLITHQVLGNTSDYTIKKENNDWERIDIYRAQVAIYGTSMGNTLATLGLVEAEIEGWVNVGINDNTLLCLDRVNTIGPRWLGKEGFYQLIIELEGKMGTFITASGQRLFSGTTSVSIGSYGATITQAFGFVPSQVICNVSKPTNNDLTIFASVAKDSITANGFSVTLSGAPDKIGYAIEWVAIK